MSGKTNLKTSVLMAAFSLAVISTASAKILGIGERTLYRKIKEYNL